MLEDGTVTTELQEVTVLTCTKTEHTHTDACYAGERTLICGLEETLPSTPEDPSQTPETPEVPDTPDVPGVPADPNAPHHHTDACYAPMDPICGLEEHAHGGDCIKSDTLEYICGKIEHTHTDECYPEPRTLICGLEEGQIPGEETPEEKPVEQPVEMGTWFTAATVENDSQMTQAIVRCTAEAGIPADAELHIRRVEDGAELDSQARQAREITGQMGMEEVELSFYDIGFTWQGQEIEPKVPVTVELHWFGADAQEISATTAMIHYGSSGPEVVDHYLVEDGVVFETDGFSNYAVVKKARAATSSNLAGFTTGVTITAANGDVITIDSSGNATAKDKDGNPIAATDIKIYVGETYKVNVSFAEVADGNISHQFDPSGMTYQIPGVLSCNAVTNMPLNVGDKQIGTYSIDTTGKLTVTLTDNDFIASQTAKMNIEFDATAVKNSQSQQEGFDFGNNVNVNIEVRNEAQVEVEKYAHTFDPATRTIEYDITAKVVKGSVTELELKDYLDDTKGYYKVIDNTLTVKDLDGRELTGYTVEKTFHGNGTFSRPEGNVHSSKEVTTVKISGGDGFKAGEGVKLNYKVEVQESFFAQNPGSSIITGSVMNQVNLTGKKDGTPVTDYDRVEKSFKATRLDKKYEEVDGKIKWTVRIGDGKMALKDQSVTDTLKADSGMTYDKSIPIQLIPIKLVKDSVEERSNHPTTYQWDDDNITSDDSSFTIRKLPAPRDDYNAFELVYYTTKGTGFDPNKNEVSIGGITASGGGTPAIVKTGEDNKNGTLEYKIEVTVPAGFQGKPVWIDDALKCTTMSGAPGFNNPVPEDLKVTVTPEGGNAVTFTAGRTTNNNSYTYYIRQSGSSYKFYIGFSVGNTDKNEDKTVNEKDGSWPFSEAATITVTYSVSTDNVLVEGDETTTVEGALSGNYVVGNRARFYYASDKYKEANKDIARIQEISKSGEQMKDGTIHYVVNFPNGANKNIHVLPADTSDIWLDDTFDSRLEYVEGSLKMYFYDKNDPSDISNMYFVYGKDGKNNPLIGSGHIKVSAKDFYRIKILETDKDGKPTKTETRPDQDFIYQFISESTTRYKNKSIRFEYDLKPKDGVFSTVDGQTTVTLNNEAKMSWIGSSDTSGKPTESAPARSSVEYNVGVLDKWGEQDERPGYNDTLHYTIELNRAGLELGKNGTYDVTDTMSADLAVMVDTVKVEKCENGNWTELTKGTDYTVSFSEQGGEQVMTFTDLPDETHLRITYDTRIKGTAGSANVSNTAVLKGSTTYSTVDTASYDINRNQSEAWYELKKILLVKQDALNTEIKLSDAVFALYTENESYTGSEPPAGVQDKTILVPVNGEQRTLYFRGLYTTDSNGEVWIGNGGEGDQPLTPKVLYALVEVTPPAGYVKSTKRTYFYVGEKSSNSPLENAKIVTSGGFLTISNTPTGYELPETGSDGSMTYVALGALLLCGGGLLAARRGRKRRA